jgi:hypothetical protein
MAELDEYERQEKQRAMQEKIAYLDEMERAAWAKQQRDMHMRQETLTNKIIMKKMQKRGFTPESWQKALASDPDAAMAAMEDAIDGYVKNVSKSSGRRAEPKGRLANSRPPRQTESRSSRGSNYEELKEKAKAGRVSDDELIDHLSLLLR